jgi:hypothetical protein
MKIKRLLLFICSACLLTSCNKGMKSIAGDYSYKVSGEVRLITPRLLDSTRYDTTYQIVTQRGQMDVHIDKQQKDSRLIVTLNESSGGIHTLYATVSGDSILFDPADLSMAIHLLSASGSTSSNTLSSVYQVAVEGSGIANDDMLLIRQTWNGRRTSDSTATLYAPKMTFIAEKN